MSKRKPHVLPQEVHEAIEYFKEVLELDSSNKLYVKLIDFSRMSQENVYVAKTLINFYKNQPVKYIASLKDGYQVEKPITQQEGLELFQKGENVVIIHKKSGQRHNVDKSSKLPKNFDLIHLDEWNWFYNKDEKLS